MNKEFYLILASDCGASVHKLNIGMFNIAEQLGDYDITMLEGLNQEQVARLIMLQGSNGLALKTTTGVFAKLFYTSQLDMIGRQVAALLR